jgi:serine/threonine-protein kinase ATR
LLENLGEDRLHTLIQCLEWIPCTITDSVIRQPHANKHGVQCLNCDSQFDFKSQVETGEEILDELRCCHRLLCQLAGLQAIRSSRKLRIALARAVRRFIRHFDDAARLSISSDPLGEWSIKGIQSSSREIRMSVSHASMAYLRSDIREDIRNKNRSSFLELLRFLSNRDSLAQKESRLHVWAMIGRTCGEVELNIALLELVGALGHPHSMIHGSAYHQLRRLAQSLDRRPIELLSPFWSSIAPEVIKNLMTCPQRPQLLSDLLDLRNGVDEFILLTQSETVPFLILTKRHEILNRVVQAKRGGGTVEKFIVESHKNRACILARLLLEAEGSVNHAISLLQQSAPKLRTPFAEMVEMEAVMIACEILKAVGDWPEPRKSKARDAFNLLAVLVQDVVPANSKADVEPHLAFVDDYGLGIMAYFTDITEKAKIYVTVSEKLRALRAIEQLIIIAGSHIDMLLAQVSFPMLRRRSDSPRFVLLYNQPWRMWIWFKQHSKHGLL